MFRLPLSPGLKDAVEAAIVYADVEDEKVTVVARVKELAIICDGDRPVALLARAIMRHAVWASDRSPEWCGGTPEGVPIIVAEIPRGEVERILQHGLELGYREEVEFLEEFLGLDAEA